MCGIAGFVDRQLSEDHGADLLRRMLQTIRHRGPDDTSSWVDVPVFLGHNRLSIIDTSARANQPMHFDDLVIVHNGEVYNYLEIKETLLDDGYRFRTDSDTEVIVAAYKKWGAGCVSRFIGMWAFCIWSKTKRELFCSRDRFGIKPLYYIHSGERLYFGSEYKPLKLSPLFQDTLNQRQIWRGIQLGWISYEDETYFESLRLLPEASNLFFRDGKLSIERYWDIDPSRRYHGTPQDKKQRFSELFRDTVRLHMRSDVEVGAMLSGGLDSSSIVSAVALDHPEMPFKTFTIYYEGAKQMDERPWVGEVARTYPNIKPIYYCPSDDEVRDGLEHLNDAFDAPILGSAAFSRYFVTKLAAEQGMKVLLEGEGADEYLAGYGNSFFRLIAGQLQRLELAAAFASVQQRRGRRGLAGFVLKSLLASVLTEQTIDAMTYLYYYPFLPLQRIIPFEARAIEASRLSQFLYHLLVRVTLPTFLHSGDRISMLFSIECRVPFLDHRLVEFVFSLPDEDKIFRGQTKFILRESLRPILPPAIANRRDKQPFFGGEAAKWLRGPLRHLLERDFDRLDMLNRKKVKRLVQAFKNGDDRKAGTVWRLAFLNYWMQGR